MTTPSERDIAQVFDKALALSPDVRRKFVEEASRDNPELGDELRSLLEASDSADAYFDKIGENVIAPALAAVAKSEGTAESDELQARLQVASSIGRAAVVRSTSMKTFLRKIAQDEVIASCEEITGLPVPIGASETR